MKKYRKIKAQANVNLLCFSKILNKKFKKIHIHKRKNDIIKTKSLKSKEE